MEQFEPLKFEFLGQLNIWLILIDNALAMRDEEGDNEELAQWRALKQECLDLMSKFGTDNDIEIGQADELKQKVHQIESTILQLQMANLSV